MPKEHSRPGPKNIPTPYPKNDPLHPQEAKTIDKIRKGK